MSENAGRRKRANDSSKLLVEGVNDAKRRRDRKEVYPTNNRQNTKRVHTKTLSRHLVITRVKGIYCLLFFERFWFMLLLFELSSSQNFFNSLTSLDQHDDDACDREDRHQFTSITCYTGVCSSSVSPLQVRITYDERTFLRN